jgi:hypothetical protein
MDDGQPKDFARALRSGLRYWWVVPLLAFLFLGAAFAMRGIPRTAEFVLTTNENSEADFAARLQQLDLGIPKASSLVLAQKFTGSNYTHDLAKRFPGVTVEIIGNDALSTVTVSASAKSASSSFAAGSAVIDEIRNVRKSELVEKYSGARVLLKESGADLEAQLKGMVNEAVTTSSLAVVAGYERIDVQSRLNNVRAGLRLIDHLSDAVDRDLVVRTETDPREIPASLGDSVVVLGFGIVGLLAGVAVLLALGLADRGLRTKSDVLRIAGSGSVVAHLRKGASDSQALSAVVGRMNRHPGSVQFVALSDTSMHESAVNRVLETMQASVPAKPQALGGVDLGAAILRAEEVASTYLVVAAGQATTEQLHEVLDLFSTAESPLAGIVYVDAR